MRNTQYEFVDLDAEGIVNSLVSTYEEMTGYSVKPGSPEKQFISWVAYIVLLERAYINAVGNANIPSRAEGEDLDALGELIYDVARPQATAATTTVRFSISEAQDTSVLIPSGTRVTDKSSTMFWQTEDDVYIPIGSTYVDIPVICQNTGSEGNGYEIGQIDTVVDVYEYYSSVSNLTVSDGGSNAATDDEYYELLRLAMDSPSTAGARGTYVYYAKSVDTEIADVVANSPSAGEVALYALMKDGTIASSEVKAAILAACNAEDVRPLTDLVTVEDADEVSYNIAFTYYVPSDTPKSQTQMTADINEAVNKYIEWQSAKFGRDINPDKLRELLFACGIKRVVITSPVFTVLNDGLDNTAPEVAKLGTKTITNGGYEDE